jgi:hypothetical protein
VYLRVAFGIGSYREDFSMDDKWLRQQADRIKSDIENKKVKDEKFVETQKLKQNLAPSLWRELKDWLRQSSEALNKEMGHEVVRFFELSGDEITLAGKADGMYTTMIVRNDQRRLVIEYESQGGDPSAKFEIGIRPDGTAGLLPERIGVIRTPADVGKDILHYATQVSRH